jgi:hypothetical protein
VCVFFLGERKRACVGVLVCVCLPSKFQLHSFLICFLLSVPSSYIYIHLYMSKCRSRKDALVEVVDAIR